MATYTVKVKSVCTGGEHITVTVSRDGKVVKDFLLTRTDLFQTELTWEDVLPFLIRQTIKTSGANTLAKAKTVVESAEWVI